MKKETGFISQFKANANEHIPFCMHYDDKTILTKDGHLIQTIHISGIYQENISATILHLRKILRDIVKDHIQDPNISLWIQTVRRKTNLDDTTPYPTSFSQNVHNIWVKKNYWNDKFVNSLYISFVYKGKSFEIKNLKDFIKSFNDSAIRDEQFSYLEEARKKLEEMIVPILSKLQEFGVERLGVTMREGISYSEILELFCGVIKGYEAPIKIDETDLSYNLGSFDYAVGNSKLELVSNLGRKFASLISIKEYQDVSTQLLDRVLQIPTEFVITEIMHFIPEKLSQEFIEYQHSILKVSKSEEMIEAKGINELLDSEGYKFPVCYQQISMMVIHESVKALDAMLSNASLQLSKVGIVHVLEDINLENSFWSQIPSNFKYLRRECVASVKNVGALATLINFPVGNHVNPWGKAITILRSERGTPYFFNFHDSKGRALSLVIGNSRSGKTTIANFLVSEAQKFVPATLFITYADDSKVFILANSGTWKEGLFKIDPFKVSLLNNEKFIEEYLTSMTYNYYFPLSDVEKEELKKLVDYFVKMQPEDRSFAKIADYDFSGKAELMKIRLKDYLPGGQFYDHFIYDNTMEQEDFSGMYTLSLYGYTDAVFAKEHYPQEERFLKEYEEKLNKFRIFRELLTLANILKYKELVAHRRNIVKFENFNTICTGTLSMSFYERYFDIMSADNTIYINSIQFAHDAEFFEMPIWNEMQKIFTTKIYLTAETVPKSWKEKLRLTEEEFAKLKALIPASRLFLVKQEELALTCELSLGGLSGILRLMSAEKHILEACDKIISEKGSDPNNWLIEFYDSIRA